jgi:putative cofactor-binding repeat protein
MGDVGLKEAIAMALGGMIGGGIYSAFGIVVAISGNVAWVAFVVAGIVAMCAGYSYVKLNKHMDGNGGAPSFIREYTGYDTLAGMTGWSLLVGYIGSMALYAYAFAGFFSEMVGRLHIYGFPVFSFVVVALIAAFVGLNLLGAGETAKAEDVLTSMKVLVIGVFGLWGIWYALKGQTLELGFGNIVSRAPIMAAAMSFVAFQGWQLLMYGQDQFENPFDDVKKAIYVSIPAATFLYAIVAVTTTSLLRISVIAVAPEVSLLYAGIEFMGRIGTFVIGLSALFSTASAVNATLFNGAQFSSDLIEMGLLPAWLSGSGDSEIPKKLVVILGTLSAAFGVYGSLSSITSFASLVFIAVFGGMSYLAFKQRHEFDDLIAVVPAVGAVGSAVFFPLLLYNLYLNSPSVFYLVLLITVLVVGVELLYFEREPVEELLPWLSAPSENEN